MLENIYSKIKNAKKIKIGWKTYESNNRRRTKRKEEKSTTR